MPEKIQPEGTCSFCGETMTKRKLTNHLKKCVKRQEAIDTAEKQKVAEQNLFHLKVKFPHSQIFWLDLEVNGSATLDALDSYLRAIWLECCGHLSEFSEGERWGTELEETRKIDSVFAKQDAIFYAYDFGSTTELVIEKIGVRNGKPITKYPIVLMSRNILPEEECIECGEKAEYICIGCHDEGSEGLLCEEHAEDHPHNDDYGEPLLLVNSPRAGVCGYDGPAEPPY